MSDSRSIHAAPKLVTGRSTVKTKQVDGGSASPDASLKASDQKTMALGRSGAGPDRSRVGLS